MAKGEEIPKTNPAEIENLIEQIRGTNLEQSSKEKIERLLRTVLMLVNLLQRKNMSIRKLRDLIFGPRTEKNKRPNADGEEKSETEEGETQGASESNQSTSVEQNSAESGRKAIKKGHGRRPASTYSGAQVVNCRHQQLKASDNCPDPLCGGKLYDLNEPVMLLQFTGQPLITATNYVQEVLRCAKCQDRYTAPLPEGVKPERYDATCDATIALLRYGMGFPWVRQSLLQLMCGIPFSPSTMWERCVATRGR